MNMGINPKEHAVRGEKKNKDECLRQDEQTKTNVLKKRRKYDREKEKDEKLKIKRKKMSSTISSFSYILV